MNEDVRRHVYNYQLINLTPFSKYLIQLGACNRVGCTYAPLINSDRCTTLEALPTGLRAPECTDLSNVELNQASVFVKWPFPEQPNGLILNFKLYRLAVSESIAYDMDYKERTSVDLKTEIYSGLNSSFVDLSVCWFCEYEYFVEVTTSGGASLTPTTRLKTKPSIPTYLIKIGSIISVTNESVTLNLKPPLNINGELRNIILVISVNKITYEMDMYSQLMLLNAKFDAAGLRAYLSNITVSKLHPNSSHEIRTKFCNQYGCTTSLESIRFNTLFNDYFEYFKVTTY